MPPRTRLVSREDAAELCTLVLAHRDFLRPWEPSRAASYFTQAGQAESIARDLEEHAQGRALPLVILDETGAVVGRLNLSEITRGAAQSACLGYWVAEEQQARGVTTDAVAEAADQAFTSLGLHRLQAASMVHNIPAQRVLQQTGFQAIGFAERYLRIDGQWQDHILYQLLAPGEG
ncbi:MAG: GNAT family N-acetyltransferase [Angustibacter sp.]